VRTAFEEAEIPADYTIFREGDAAIAGVRDMAAAGTVPHLVLLDLNLPRASGHQVLLALRALPAFATVPVVILSTSNHPADRNRCLAGGADDYRVKPPFFGELLVLVQELRARWLTAVG
jgi:CheY-like chemotaxis protein